MYEEIMHKLVYHEIKLMVKSLTDLAEICTQKGISLSSLRLSTKRIYRWGNLEIARSPIRTFEVSIVVYNAKFFLNKWFNFNDAQYLIEKLGTPVNIWSVIRAFREVRDWCEQKKRKLQTEAAR